ncbi:MAG: response regulator [Oscillospiraceae bacterium]|nr:response regulator [Oscillospiraceae bacterium]
MNTNFMVGYRCSLVFYSIECIVVMVISLVMQRLPLPALISFAALYAATMILFYRGNRKHKLKEKLYMRLQCVAFVIANVFASITFDSAQVFVYAMCFSSIVSFIFLDVKLARFQMFLSMGIIIVVAGFISVYTGSQQTMMAFTFGVVVMIVINWVIVSMTNIITFQNRKSIEQERSLDDLLKVLEVKCDEARAATQSKSRFLAHMSHEIRTPINAVMGMNEMILRESNEEQIRSYASDAKSAARSLLGIINDILDITKIEAGKLNIVPVEFNLADMIIDLYNMVRFKAEDKGLRFEVTVDSSLPALVKGDDLRIKEVLVNLLSNAVKYTREGTITLDVRFVDDQAIRFSVKDTGIGIREEDMETLFAAFARMDEVRNHGIEGTGLGLNITSSLLLLMDSELKVKSEYGKGSEFYFTLCTDIIDRTPIGELDLVSHERHEAEYSVAFEAPDARILVVDDNEMNRAVFANLLKATRVQISEASGGRQCLELTSANRYDIIFMDHMMPEMDGVDTFKAIRADADNLCRDVPIIVLTANAVAGAREQYMQIGFDDFLTKPVDPQRLERMVYSVLDKSLVRSAEKKTLSTVQASTVELPVIEGVDWGYAKLHFNDESALLSTVRMFTSAIKSDIEELNGYYENIDDGQALISYRVKVHSMKSSAAMIGIVQLAGMAMELEKAARSESRAVITALHPVFAERWLSYSLLLSEFTKNDAPQKDAADNLSEIEEIFAGIRAAASDMDVDALDELSRRLDGYAFPEEKQALIDLTRSQILNFEVEKLTESYY